MGYVLVYWRKLKNSWVGGQVTVFFTALRVTTVTVLNKMIWFPILAHKNKMSDQSKIEILEKKIQF